MELIGGVRRKLRQVSSLSVDANQSFVILNGGAIKKEYRSILYEMLAPFMFHQCTSMFEETRCGTLWFCVTDLYYDDYYGYEEDYYYGAYAPPPPPMHRGRGRGGPYSPPVSL